MYNITIKYTWHEGFQQQTEGYCRFSDEHKYEFQI